MPITCPSHAHHKPIMPGERTNLLYQPGRYMCQLGPKDKEHHDANAKRDKRNVVLHSYDKSTSV